MGRKNFILNNTKVIMNLFSFLEISDLVKMRNLNSCCKLISDHYIKISIHKDKSKYTNIEVENSDESNNNAKCYCPSKFNNINNNNNTSQLRMKFLQLWNIYSNKNSMEKVNYYDYNLCFLIKIIIYLISNVKDGLDFSFIPTSTRYFQQIYGYGLDDSPSLSSNNNNTMNINNHQKHNYINLERDLDLDLEQDDYTDFQSNSSSIGLNINHNYENIPIYIQEFFKNEEIWKVIAKLSGYNLSNAELLSESNGIFEHYLWPEKMEDPKYSIIDQNIIEHVFSIILRMKNLDPNIRKQISILMNKNFKAELTFYSNSGNIINRSNINIIKDQFNPSFINKDNSNNNNNNHHHHCNTDFLRDIYHNINSNYPSENINSVLQPCTFINSQLSSIILLWIINFLKLQKQLPCLRQIPKSDKFFLNSNDNNNKYRLQHRHNQFLHNHNYNSNKIPFNSKLSSTSRLSRLNNINNKNNENQTQSQSQSHGMNKCQFSNINLGDIPETFGKLCNIINSQENLLIELKQILNTIK
ncbi:uncharacterized protein ELE39_001464 [Cryptosporidium sp. chipmunk genotype I]|uniref:uncharacterized protein n=1 Tax=Cryptosporidium sp. chipmunk genotype I TaxID=1280935 RepID=UPI00351A1EDC|nr:hypothetical protein ELE39_001464 [Cryptosporidium sp. chipmunk genotype I]